MKQLNHKQSDSILVSVLVPVYNMSLYIRRCIKSILSQTYHNIEIILVDDGSTDTSGQLCDEFATLDDRVVVIHQANGGLVCARQVGLCKSRGQYILPVDADDYIDTNMARRRNNK